jgi:diguanylate cyclase (GGDEF)-like protein/PAS domain S-box-containing protein
MNDANSNLTTALEHVTMRRKAMTRSLARFSIVQAVLATISMGVIVALPHELHMKLEIGIGFLMVGTAMYSYFFLLKPSLQAGRDEETANQQAHEAQDQENEQLKQRTKQLEERETMLSEKIQETELISENFRLATFRLQKVLASIPIPCVGCDVHGNVFEWNEAAERMFKYGLFEVFEQPLSKFVLEANDVDSFQAKIAHAVENDEPLTFECPAHNREDHRAMIEWSLMPMRGVNGEVSSVMITAVDITERVLQEQRLKEMAFKDALTGLVNRRSFLQTLGEAYTAVSEEMPISVILMDVDKFKVYNDTYGHPAGDALLRRVGDLLREVCPSETVPGRYGGEEFIVLAPGHNPEQAFALADDIRKAIEAYTGDLHGATASFGVSTTFSADLPESELIQQADLALYASKHNGRNQCTNFDPDKHASDHAA